MNEYLAQIGRRIRELRESLEITSEDAAARVGVPAATYLDYENSKADIPVGVLYAIAGEFGVDPTVLMTGDDPRMDEYSFVRKGQGISCDRYPGYSFSALAFNFKHRVMEPMIVTLSRSTVADLVTHPGQEFNYVIEGTVKVIVGKREFVMDAGDSLYFIPTIPHGQQAVTPTAKFLTVIKEN